MNTVGSWDYTSPDVNETLPQINRQKSALNLEIVVFDEQEAVACFRNKDGSQNVASRFSCDCRDFNFAGQAPRKKFAPCKHMYRLAFESKLLAPKFLDAKARAKLFTERFQEIRRVDALYELAPSPSHWGSWNPQVHDHYTQLLRQFRARQIFAKFPEQTTQVAVGYVNGYSVTLSSCDCPDFEDRRMPCKHIYTLAIGKGIEIPFTDDRYRLIGGNEERVLGYVLAFPRADEPAL